MTDLTAETTSAARETQVRRGLASGRRKRSPLRAMSGRNKQLATSFLKGLDLLTVLAREPEGLSMPALTAGIRQPRTTLLRLLVTLEHYGLVARHDAVWQTTGVEPPRERSEHHGRCHVGWHSVRTHSGGVREVAFLPVRPRRLRPMRSVISSSSRADRRACRRCQAACSGWR